jgi:hypothetical protein
MPKNKKPAGGRPAKNFEPRYGSKTSYQDRKRRPGEASAGTTGSKSAGHRGYRAEEAAAAAPKRRWTASDRAGRDESRSIRSTGRDERPARSFDDRPARRVAGERPTRSFDDRAPRTYGDRPQRDDRAPRTFGDRPQRDDRARRDERPARSFDERPARSSHERPQRDERPARSLDDRVPRNDRPRRSDGPGRSDWKATPKAYDAHVDTVHERLEAESVVAESVEDARKQWCDVFGRDRADLGPAHAREAAAEAIERYGPRARKHRPIPSLPPEFDHRLPAPSPSGPGIGF